jgi:hypothetical protein
MIAYYHHLKSHRGRYFISDVVDAARQHDVARSIPSNGLHQLQIAAAFRNLKLSPIQYVSETLSDINESFERLACRYLNSALPVLLLLPGHAIVLIGYGRRSNGDLFFVCHDDAVGPYRTIGDSTSDPERPWQGLLVPLPDKIYLTAEAAERVGREHLSVLIATEDDLSDLRALETRYRTYVCSSADYKMRLTDRGLPGDVVRWHRLIGASHYVWIVELQDAAAAAQGRECVIGEIAIDATSDPLTPLPLAAHLPGRVLGWTEINGAMRQASSGQDLGGRFETATAVHA